jgi:hypothetical protein
MPTEEASSSSAHATPFKVQINFDIPLFQGLIDVDVVDIWLNFLEGYFLIRIIFSARNEIGDIIKKCTKISQIFNNITEIYQRCNHKHRDTVIHDFY